MSRILMLVPGLFALLACNNSSDNESSKDSAGKSMNTGEDNYIMENNVRQEIKKPGTARPDETDYTTMPAVDTVMVPIDTTRK